MTLPTRAIRWRLAIPGLAWIFFTFLAALIAWTWAPRDSTEGWLALLAALFAVVVVPPALVYFHHARKESGQALPFEGWVITAVMAATLAAFGWVVAGWRVDAGNINSTWGRIEAAMFLAIIPALGAGSTSVLWDADDQLRRLRTEKAAAGRDGDQRPVM
ncbi:hypothetical protein [Micromonospora sonchi]|nr:hypothetical protein [Micromonospora sonchi]